MTHDDLEQIATQVAHRYKARASWIDIDEMRQVAWLAIVRAQRTFDKRVGTPRRAYLWHAALRACGNALHRFSAPASAGRGNHRLHELVHVGPALALQEDTPDWEFTYTFHVASTVVEVENVLDLARTVGHDAATVYEHQPQLDPDDAAWRNEVWQALTDAVRDEPYREHVLDVLLGAERPTDVAHRVGIEPRVLIAAVRRARKAIACSYQLWKLHRARVGRS